MHLDGTPGPLIRRFGRRGVFLMMFGLVYVVFGGSVLSIAMPRFAAVAMLGSFLDSSAWGVMWVVGGVVAMVNGFYRYRSHADAPGFTALLVPPVVWSIFYATSAVSYVATGGVFGRITSISGVAVWALVWLVVTLVSGWPDADSATHARK